MAGQTNVSLNISDGDVDSSPCVYAATVGTSINGVIVVVGIIGNILTVVVFWKGNFKSSTSFIFLSLSVIDSAVLLTVSAFYTLLFSRSIGWLPPDSNIRVYLLVCVYPLACMAETATIWVTVLIAANRYIIVCLPLRASRWCTLAKVKIQLAVVLVSAVLNSIPSFVRKRVVRNNTTYVATIEDVGEQSLQQFYDVYDNVLPVVLLWCLPLFILTLLTTRLLNAMKAHRRMQGESQSTSNQEDSSMTFALVIVVIVFVMCQAPRLLWIAIQYLSEPFDMVWCYSFQILCTLILLSSAVNFFIYIVMNKRFRDVLTNGVARIFFWGGPPGRCHPVHFPKPTRFSGGGG